MKQISNIKEQSEKSTVKTTNNNQKHTPTINYNREQSTTVDNNQTHSTTININYQQSIVINNNNNQHE